MGSKARKILFFTHLISESDDYERVAVEWQCLVKMLNLIKLSKGPQDVESY